MSLSIALTALSGAALAQPAANAPDYTKPQHWICLPGREDECAKPLAVAALQPNDYGPVQWSRPAKADPGLDCFAVYPTVSGDSGLNSDLSPSAAEEGAMARINFAQFSSVCRVYVPLYRQMTTNAVVAASIGTDVSKAAFMAYGDVASAWATYLAKHNQGRPFVLIGHSQGSLMLQQLIANAIETDPAVAKRMKLAILPGFNLMVPSGKTVGGTLKRTPICTAALQTGCVMSWVSFRDRNMPPKGALFGHSAVPGMDVACTNPVEPGADGARYAKSIWFARSRLPVPGGPIEWMRGKALPADHLETNGLVSLACMKEGQASWLNVRIHPDAADARTDRIGGEVGIMGMFLPGWGMHLVDLQVAKRDLLDRVARLQPNKGAKARPQASPPPAPQPILD